MNELKEIFRQFESITMSYSGKNTDWKQKSEDLTALIKKAKNIKIKYSLNSPFYTWIKKELIKAIEYEETRVFVLFIENRNRK